MVQITFYHARGKIQFYPFPYLTHLTMAQTHNEPRAKMDQQIVGEYAMRTVTSVSQGIIKFK